MAAVEVRNGFKHYGSSKNPVNILNGLNMNVMKGNIYGLLGASGCGKTTLLSCIVGQRQLNSGEIKVLGLKPGLPGSGIPGPRIGYMPQEIALVEQMSISETFWYFGRIYGMSAVDIQDRFTFLKKLLELPPADRLVGCCSGGQQRRVSFACAMIHVPQLLILDEPTVGLDPLLRERIWDFLVETTKKTKCAVIITTHYIEECRKANYIGLMRTGVLLAESTPQELMEKFECSSIEDAFLLLSQKQSDSINDSKIASLQTESNTNTPIQVITVDTDTKFTPLPAGPDFPFQKRMSFQEQKPPGILGAMKFTSKARMKALLTKNWVQFIRQKSGLLFMFFFPIIQLTCFYAAIGKPLNDLSIGIVNEEASLVQCNDKNLVTVVKFNDTCELSKISCRFLKHIDPDVTKPIYYETEQEAYEAARDIETNGYIHFARNFSEAMQAVLDDRQFSEEWNLENREIKIHLDMIDQQTAFYLERKFRDSYKIFIEDIMYDCGIPRRYASIPVNFMTPIYSSFEDEYQKFVAPGMVIIIVFFIETIMTANVFITERADGVWDRSLVAGITTSEMLLAHVITQSLIVILQVSEIIIFIALAFDLHSEGETDLYIYLLVGVGFCGMLFGLLISIFSNSHTVAMFVATGAFYPLILLTGVMWPTEAMDSFLEECVQLLPFTIPIVSARSILEKKYSFGEWDVLKGFGMLAIWIVILSFLCIIGIRRKM